MASFVGCLVMLSDNSPPADNPAVNTLAIQNQNEENFSMQMQAITPVSSNMIQSSVREVYQHQYDVNGINESAGHIGVKAVARNG